MSTHPAQSPSDVGRPTPDEVDDVDEVIDATVQRLLAEVERLYPERLYPNASDKTRYLTALVWAKRVTNKLRDLL